MLGLQDFLLNQTGALPAAAGSTNSGAMDLGVGITVYDETEWTRVEFEIDAPALTTTQLPNAATATYDVIVSATSNLASPVAVYPGILVQTGSGGTGAAAATKKFKLPGKLNDYLANARYLGVRCTTANTPGNCSASSMSLKANF